MKMKSKTKIGATIVGIGAGIVTLNELLTGNISIVPGLAALVTELGAVYLAYGIRDTPLFNKK